MISLPRSNPSKPGELQWRAKTLPDGFCFLISIGIARDRAAACALSQKGDATEATKDHILVATMPLAPPAHAVACPRDVAWHSGRRGPPGADQFRAARLLLRRSRPRPELS